MSSTKHKAIRILAVIFAALMLVPLLAACSNNGNGDESSDPVGSTATTDTQETRLGTLPEKLDLGKATVAILYWSDVINPEFEVEETDRITSAIHAKDSRVQEMLNVNIEWTGEAGGKSKLENFKKRVEAGISTNESEVVAAHSMVMGALASSGYMQDLLSTKYLNFENPWWLSDLIRFSTIGGKLYFASGDISNNTLLGMEGMFFNKDVVTSDL